MIPNWYWPWCLLHITESWVLFCTEKNPWNSVLGAQYQAKVATHTSQEEETTSLALEFLYPPCPLRESDKDVRSPGHKHSRPKGIREAGDLILSAGLHGHQEHTWFTDRHTGKAPVHINPPPPPQGMGKRSRDGSGDDHHAECQWRRNQTSEWNGSEARDRAEKQRGAEMEGIWTRD